jgi:alpha-amylase
LGLGADGFRFDAAKQIEPEYFEDVLSVVPAGTFFYGEVIGQNLAESNLYTPRMRVTDFHLLTTMLGAFSLNGDLRGLIDPEAAGGALPGGKAVVFARNHDTAMHSDFFNFGDYQDALLATAFVLARGVGTPFVYKDDAEQAVVESALKFHNQMGSQSTYIRKADDVCGSACDARTLLFIERGGKGLMILNTANNALDIGAARMPGLQAGCYKEIANGTTMVVTVGSDGQKWVSEWQHAGRGGFTIGPRSALYLVQQPAAACQS